MNLYHFCYEVSDIAKTVQDIKSSGGIISIKPTPAILFEGRLVAFLITPLGLIELLNRA